MPTAAPARRALKPAHFTVDFGFLTQTARDFWAEHSFDRAVRLITCSGIPLAVAHDIIRGKKRMAQDPKGREGVDGIVLPDKWKPNPKACQHGIYPDPDDLPKLAADGMNAKAQLIEHTEATLRQSLHTIQEEIQQAIERNEYDTVMQMFEFYDELPEHIRKGHRLPYNRAYMEGLARKQRADRARAAAGLPKNDPVEKFIAHQRDLDTRPAPTPSTDYSSNNAWLLPNGKFYALKSSMEHIWGARMIADISEKGAEDRGWLKISYGIFGINILIHRTPTQKQMDTLFDWAMADEARRLNAFNEFKKRECEE